MKIPTIIIIIVCLLSLTFSIIGIGFNIYRLGRLDAKKDLRESPNLTIKEYLKCIEEIGP